MSEISDFICIHHPDSERVLTTVCPVCLQIACNKKDAEIAKLKASFQQSTEARTGWLNEFDGYKLQILELRQRLSEARHLMQYIGTTGANRGEVIQSAIKWLEKTP